MAREMISVRVLSVPKKICGSAEGKERLGREGRGMRDGVWGRGGEGGEGVRVEVGEVWGTVLGNTSSNKKSHEEKDSHHESSVTCAAVAVWQQCRCKVDHCSRCTTLWEW